ncbi:hypothetical protein OH492_13535 [Vibrio chagasii]|nr:hypothetical protein [Vibrio chagasii]
MKIPNNYYLDIQAQFDLEDESIEQLQKNNILYTENDTRRSSISTPKKLELALFFEVVQQGVGGIKYGETNAFI